jgi:DNA repair exonuclease SbcCD ATPase subunit
MKRIVIFAFSIVVALLVTSCAKSPETLIQQAETALEAAEAAGAQTYAPDAWNRAKQAMESLNAELSAQNQRFGLFRNFNSARSLAEEVTNAADQAKAEADRKKAQLRADSTKMIADVKSSLQSARNQLSGLPRTAAVNTTNLRLKLDEAGRLLDKAQSELGIERFDSAMASAGGARDNIVEVLRVIEQASPRPAAKKR